MPPRGRARKRLSRMDAATDAMTAFGFDERLVQRTVKQLLKEYGGDDGWVFIEEYGYKELIDAILRDQESNDEDATKQKGVSPHDERAEDPALQSILCPSGTVVDSTYNKAGNTVGETSCSELVNAVEPIYVELCRNKQDICSTEVFCSPPVEGNGNSWKDVVKGQITTQKETGTTVCRDGGNSKNQVQHGSNSHVFAPPPVSSYCPVNYLKLCSGSHAQAWNNSHVSVPPPTASLCPFPVDHHLTVFPSSKGVSSQGEKTEDCALESSGCPLGPLVDSTFNEAGNTPGETGYSKLVDAVGEPTHEELCSHKQDIGNTGKELIIYANLLLDPCKFLHGVAIYLPMPGNGNKLNNVEKPFESGSPTIQQEILKLQRLGSIKPLSIGNKLLGLTLGNYIEAHNWLKITRHLE